MWINITVDSSWLNWKYFLQVCYWGERERNTERLVSRRGSSALQVVGVTSFRAGGRHCFRVSWNGSAYKSACKYKTSWAVAFNDTATGGLRASQHTGCTAESTMESTTIAVRSFQNIICRYIPDSLKKFHCFLCPVTFLVSNPSRNIRYVIQNNSWKTVTLDAKYAAFSSQGYHIAIFNDLHVHNRMLNSTTFRLASQIDKYARIRCKRVKPANPDSNWIAMKITNIVSIRSKSVS